MRKIGMVLLGMLFAVGVQAAEVGGVKLEDKVAVGGKDLVLNGAGIRTRAIFKVYVGSLYCRRRRPTWPPCSRRRRGESSSTCCATCRRTS